jgi:hypothetical protein
VRSGPLILSVYFSFALAANAAQPSLLQLAKAKFAPHKLSLAEEKLFIAAQAGEQASAPENTVSKNNDFIRAECIQWLCTNPAAAALVAPSGILIRGLHIEGDLDLDFAQIPFPLQMSKCGFIRRIDMAYARLPAIFIDDTFVGTLNANGAKIAGSVVLRRGFKASKVDYGGATIEGDLDCSGIDLNNAQGPSVMPTLIAKGAKISGSVVLSRLDASGQVDFSGAIVGENLELVEARFQDDQESALVLYGAQITGSVLFNLGVKVQGEVDLREATIGKDFDCRGIELSNAGGNALTAEGIKIGGAALFHSVVDENGNVDTRLKIDGKMSFVNADLGNAFVWTDVAMTTKSVLDLQVAKAKTLYDDEQSWPRPNNLLLDGFAYERFDGKAPSSLKQRIRWLHRQPQSKFSPQPYLQLASVYRKMDQDHEAKQVMIIKNRDYARFIRDHQASTQGWPSKRIFGREIELTYRLGSSDWWWYTIFGRLIGYGYEPWNAFFISLGFIIFGWAIFHFGFSNDVISPTKENAYAKDDGGHQLRHNHKKKYSDDYPKFNAFVYSLESFVPLVKLDQTEYWKPNANLGVQLKIWRLSLPTTGSLLRTYLWFHIMSGWVLTSLWVAGLTGLIRT